MADLRKRVNNVNSVCKVVLIASEHLVPEWVARKFKEAKINFSHHECYSRQDLQEYASDADVIWLMSGRNGLVIEENMDIFKQAGVVIKVGSGTDNIDHEACTRRGIIVAHTPEDPVELTSDHAVALLFTAVRQTARQDRLMRRGIHDPKAALPLGSFTGAELGIIGFGRIGKVIAQKLSGFKMDIRVFDPFLDEASVKAAGGRKVGLEELLRESQYVIVQCPFNKDTEGLLGEKELRMMRPDAVLVNTARAGIVDEKALRQALENDWIAGAAFDVLEHCDDKELLSRENLTCTPHLGGWPANYPDDTFAGVVDEILVISRMQLPKWIVNKGVKPRWNTTTS